MNVSLNTLSIIIHHADKFSNLSPDLFLIVQDFYEINYLNYNINSFISEHKVTINIIDNYNFIVKNNEIFFSVKTTSLNLWDVLNVSHEFNSNLQGWNEFKLNSSRLQHLCDLNSTKVRLTTDPNFLKLVNLAFSR